MSRINFKHTGVNPVSFCKLSLRVYRFSRQMNYVLVYWVPKSVDSRLNIIQSLSPSWIDSYGEVAVLFLCCSDKGMGGQRICVVDNWRSWPCQWRHTTSMQLKKIFGKRKRAIFCSCDAHLKMDMHQLFPVWCLPHILNYGLKEVWGRCLPQLWI